MGEVAFEPDFRQSRNSIGGHRGSESGISGERNRKSKGTETENKRHIWGMLYSLVQKVHRLNVALFIARISFCFVLLMKLRITVGNSIKWFGNCGFAVSSCTMFWVFLLGPEDILVS